MQQDLVDLDLHAGQHPQEQEPPRAEDGDSDRQSCGPFADPSYIWSHRMYCSGPTIYINVYTKKSESVLESLSESVFFLQDFFFLRFGSVCNFFFFRVISVFW